MVFGECIYSVSNFSDHTQISSAIHPASFVEGVDEGWAAMM